MCRNIKTLFNFSPPATPEELRNASIQFVRKLSGFVHPSKANESAFDQAVNEITKVATKLMQSLHTHAPARNREEVSAAAARAAKRFSAT